MYVQYILRAGGRGTKEEMEEGRSGVGEERGGDGDAGESYDWRLRVVSPCGRGVVETVPGGLDLSFSSTSF